MHSAVVSHSKRFFGKLGVSIPTLTESRYMKFIGPKTRVFVIGIICGVSSCKERSPSGSRQSGYENLTEGYTKEVVPFNRIPMERLRADEEIFRRNRWQMPKETKFVQTHNGVDYGIRLINPEDLKTFIWEGDIAVDYDPIDDPNSLVRESKLGEIRQKSTGEKTEREEIGLNHLILVRLGEKGMSHAKLVVTRNGSLCHLDSPESMSDCNWDSFTHFFRVETTDDVRKSVNKMIDVLKERDSSYDYDSFLYTDIYVKGLPSFQSRMTKLNESKSSKLPPLYCSELPFSVYSLAMGRNMLETNFNMMDFAKQISDMRSEARFAPFVSNELMQQSLSAFVLGASTVPESVRPVISGGIKQLLANGYMGGSLRYLVKRYYPSLVLPQHFMLAAVSPEKAPGARVVYIGSIEKTTVEKNRAYFSTLIVETGRVALANYLQRVKDWWKNPLPSADESSLLLDGTGIESVKPTYLEPDYSR